MPVQELNATNFDTTVESNELLVIDFWAEWCGPCKAFAKIMAEVAKEYKEVVFASVNIENEKALAEEFAVRSIPFVMIIKKRAVVYADSGLLSAVSLRELLDQARNVDV